MLPESEECCDSAPRSNVGYVENAILLGLIIGLLALFSRERNLTLAVDTVGDWTPDPAELLLPMDMGDDWSMGITSDMGEPRGRTTDSYFLRRGT